MPLSKLQIIAFEQLKNKIDNIAAVDVFELLKMMDKEISGYDVDQMQKSKSLEILTDMASRMQRILTNQRKDAQRLVSALYDEYSK